jgi:hypothetical protein
MGRLATHHVFTPLRQFPFWLGFIIRSNNTWGIKDEEIDCFIVSGTHDTGSFC